MNQTEFSEDLAGALHAAAHAAPPYDGDLGLVRARGRARRQRRTAAVAGLTMFAAAAVLAVPVTIGTLTGPDAADQPSFVRSGPSEPVWLLVAPHNVFTQAEADEFVATEGNSVAEWDVRPLYGDMRPDGTVVELHPEVSEVNWIYRAAAMPDGRLAVLTIDWLTEGVSTGGNCEDHVGTIRLHVIEPDGSVSLTRELDPTSLCDEGMSPELLSADAHNVYLAYEHRSQLVAHDLATGREQVLVDSSEVQAQGFRASVAGGRVVMVIPTWPAGRCEAVVRVMEAETGVTRDYRLPPTCAEPTSTPVGPFQVSPDGRYAAAALNRGTELRLVALDIDTGAMVVDQSIVQSEGEEYFGTGYSGRAIHTTYGGISGLTWIDSSTVRVAWYEPLASMENWTDAIRSTDFVMPAGR